MFDTLESLLEQIRLGEDNRLELKSIRFRQFKVTAPHGDSIADELSAFANSAGGVMMLGIEDETRMPQGLTIEQLKSLDDWIVSICQDKIKPPLMCRILKMNLPDAREQMVPVLKIDIPKSLFVHKSPGGYFYRIGSSKRLMETDYLIRLGQQRSQARLIRFDEQAVPSSYPEILKPELFSRFKTRITKGSDHDFLAKIRFIVQDDSGEWRPTVAAILLLSESPEQFINSAFIQAVCYRGTERNAADQLDQKDITGPLDNQIREACRFVNRNMRVTAAKEPGRIEIPQFSLHAVFEAIVNAVAHRDYSIYGSKIRLHLFSDRLELFSPGTIPNTMSLDSLSLRQMSRNELITSILAKIPVDMDIPDSQRQYLMDKRGEGVPIILSESEKLSGRLPEYRLLDDSELLLTIFAAQKE